MAASKTILVTGATGQQGGAVARSLLAKGQHVRVLTRSPEKAKELARNGAEVVRGDFEDRVSLKEAVHGADGVFLMGTPFEKGPEAETEQGKSIVMACWKFGAPHVVYSSVCGANSGTGIPHFESKARSPTSGKPHNRTRSCGPSGSWRISLRRGFPLRSRRER